MCGASGQERLFRLLRVLTSELGEKMKLNASTPDAWWISLSRDVETGDGTVVCAVCGAAKSLCPTMTEAEINTIWDAMQDDHAMCGSRRAA